MVTVYSTLRGAAGLFSTAATPICVLTSSARGVTPPTSHPHSLPDVCLVYDRHPSRRESICRDAERFARPGDRTVWFGISQRLPVYLRRKSRILPLTLQAGRAWPGPPWTWLPGAPPTTAWPLCRAPATRAGSPPHQAAAVLSAFEGSPAPACPLPLSVPDSSLVFDGLS